MTEPHDLDVPVVATIWTFHLDDYRNVYAFDSDGHLWWAALERNHTPSRKTTTIGPYPYTGLTDPLLIETINWVLELEPAQEHQAIRFRQLLRTYTTVKVSPLPVTTTERVP